MTSNKRENKTKSKSVTENSPFECMVSVRIILLRTVLPGIYKRMNIRVTS
jgi:hypothetical protein